MKKNHAVQNLVLHPEGKLPKEPFCQSDFRDDEGKAVPKVGGEVQRL